MNYFEIDLNRVPKVILLGKEALIPPRLHYSQYVTKYIMYVMVSGNLELLVNGKIVELIPGDIYLFQKGDLLEPKKSSFCEYYYVHFQSDGIRSVELDVGEYMERLRRKHDLCMRTDAFSEQCYEHLNVLIPQESHVADEYMFEYITELLQNHILTTEGKLPEKRFAISSALSSILLKLEAGNRKKGDCSEQKLEKSFDTARKIAAYIEKHYAEPISSEIIEQEFFLTFDYANRIFRKIMGCTIVRYRNTVRIQYAKAKMRATNMAVKEIAMELGFENVHYFSRIFKKIEGLSPSEYKRKFLKISDRQGQTAAEFNREEDVTD